MIPGRSAAGPRMAAPAPSPKMMLTPLAAGEKSRPVEWTSDSTTSFYIFSAILFLRTNGAFPESTMPEPWKRGFETAMRIRRNCCEFFNRAERAPKLPVNCGAGAFFSWRARSFSNIGRARSGMCPTTFSAIFEVLANKSHA
jgi:hypothetical protein